MVQLKEVKRELTTSRKKREEKRDNVFYRGPKEKKNNDRNFQLKIVKGDK